MPRKRKRAASDQIPVEVKFTQDELDWMRIAADTIGIRALTEYIRLKCLEERALETLTNKVLGWLKTKPGVKI